MSPFAAILDRRGNPLEHRCAEKVEHALRGLGPHPGHRIETTAGEFWIVGVLEPERRNRDQERPGLGGFCLGAEGLDPGCLERTREPQGPRGASRAASVGPEMLLGSSRFGSAYWASLKGSYAVALMSPDGRVLHLARDPLGERTLFFAEQGSQLLLADRIETLFRLGATAPSLDASQLARFFGLESPSPGRTHFVGVEEVEPGTWLRFTSHGRELSRFWTPETDQPRAARSVCSDSDYVEEFRARLERATASLLGTPDRAGIMLSGGLDSTSLAVVAARQAEQRSERVAACSWIFDELGSCDERDGIESTLALHDFEVVQVPGDGCWPLADLELFSNLPGTPEENPFRALKSALYSAARGRGRTLLFNGGTVEIYFRGGSLYLRDLLRDRRWGAAGSGLVQQIRLSGWRSAAGSLARVLRPTGRRKAVRPPPAWLTDPAKKSWAEEMASSASLDRGIRDVVPYLAMESRGLAIENLYSKHLGVRVASPYWTRGWLDFMLSLPAHQVYRPGVNKFIAREAMRGLIPEAIRRRQQPTLLDPLFHRGVFEREAKVVDDLLRGRDSVWREFVQPSCFEGLGAASPSALKLVLWNCASFELWRRKHGWELG